MTDRPPVGIASAVLDAHLVVRRGGFRLDLPLAVHAGEVVALLGPNGAGKTTALRALAGLEVLDSGHIDLAGRRVDDPAAGLFVPPERRPIGVVFQDYLLFPHLTALDNVAFGLRTRGVPRREARERARVWLQRMGLAEHGRRRPRELSGGQAQRVALARALAVAPALLLLDEPLAALDARSRRDTRTELRRHLADHPGATVVVTHDLADAMVLADRVVIVEDGQSVQEGTPAAVAERPRTDFVARLVGLNLWRGQAAGRVVRVPRGPTVPIVEPMVGAAFVAFSPSAVCLHAGQPADVEVHWPVTVAAVERYGDAVRVTLDGGTLDGGPETLADLPPVVAAQLEVTPGRRLWATLAPERVRVYAVDPEGAPPGSP